jgi:carboxypeptidase family protein
MKRAQFRRRPSHPLGLFLRVGPAFIVPALLGLTAFITGCSGFVSGQASQTTPSPTTYSISGTISPTAGGNGATVNLSGTGSATTTASSSGNYTFNGLANGSYAITPSHTGYTFSPTSHTATINGADVTGINFTASAQTGTFSISGTISPTAGGSGATVTLSGAASVVTTANNSGSFSFTGLSNGTYTVTPSNIGYAFSPVSQNVALSGANKTGVNFTATVQQTHSVELSWNSSTSVVTGYNVYRSTVSGGGFTKINASLITLLSYTDSSVQSGKTYYYVTTAVDAGGAESGFSNQASAVVP